MNSFQLARRNDLSTVDLQGSGISREMMNLYKVVNARRAKQRILTTYRPSLVPKEMIHTADNIKVSYTSSKNAEPVRRIAMIVIRAANCSVVCQKI